MSTKVTEFPIRFDYEPVKLDTAWAKGYFSGIQDGDATCPYDPFTPEGHAFWMGWRKGMCDFGRSAREAGVL